MRPAWTFEPLVLANNHVVRRSTHFLENDEGGDEMTGRLHCDGCRRTQLVPLTPECTAVGADYLLDAAARLLHTCGCGGGGVFYADA